MSDKIIIPAVIIGAFLLGMLAAPAVIALASRLKAGQSILSYVEQHNSKQGTPTFGGLIFITASCIVAAIAGVFRYRIGLMSMLIFLGYGVIGFTDDFIKVKLKRNKGLTALQKIISQLAVAAFAAYFANKSEIVGSAIALNFGAGEWDLGGWYIPCAMLVFVAMSNAVNITDGLDGLAAGTGSIYFVFYLIIILIGYADALALGSTVYAGELRSLALAVAAVIGGLAAFLWFNSNKASIFMGDTGSLALGGLAAAVALFTKNPLVSILIGIMYVISCISVIVQVISFKTRGKRVFLMSPLHHHLELKGINESKIVSCYCIVTAIAGLTALIIIF